MFTPIIGLEIHIQLKTKSKVFCSCPNDDLAEPNTNICPICLGFPGTMPSLNKEALNQAIRMGIALNCDIPNVTSWDRKSYMYPDLFKGYQITQHKNPVCRSGYVEFIVKDRKNYYSGQSYVKKVGIVQAHLEEDTAKSIHSDDFTLLDGNKAGVPLIEIVSKPELHSVDEAVSFAKHIRNLARWFGVSDVNMEMGQMRFDANVSVCVEEFDFFGKSYEDWKGKVKFTPIVEIKNLNSFRFLECALEYEINRQIQEYRKDNRVYAKGQKETRGWDEKESKTYTLRKKEEADEYRYVPEPDIPVVVISDEYILSLKKNLPIHPFDLRGKLLGIEISDQAVDILCSEISIYKLFDRICEEDIRIMPKVALVLTNELMTEAQSAESIDDIDQWIEGLRKVITLHVDGSLSSSQFKEIVRRHQSHTSDWIQILDFVVSNSNYDLEGMLRKAISDHPKVVEDIRKGKNSAKMFFVGIIMRETKGSADPSQVISLLDKLIE